MNKQGWTYKKLGDLCEVLNGLWVGKKEPFINIAVIRNTNFSKDCKLNLENVAYIDVEQKQFATRKLFVGDIIIEKSGGSDKQPVGRPVLFNVPEGNYSFSNFTSTLRITDSSINPQFLHLCLYQYYRNGETKKMQSKTTGLRNLDMKAYLRLAIPYPPIAEQERIVEELDLLSGIIEKKKEQLKAYDQLAQSIFYTMFGDPIDNPKGWETKKLGEVVDITSSLIDPNQEPYCHQYHVSPANIVSGTGEIIGCNLAKDDMLISGKYAFEEGMILYSKIRPNLNKVAIAPFNGVCSADMYPLSTKNNVNNVFVCHLLLGSHFLNYAKKESGRARMPKINRNSLFAFEFPLPPLSLQQEFAEKVEAIERQKALVQQSIDETQTMFDCTMDKYFG